MTKIAPNFIFKLSKARVSVPNEQLKCPPKPPKARKLGKGQHVLVKLNFLSRGEAILHAQIVD